MSTVITPAADSELVERLESRNRRLTRLVVILALALIGLGVWMVFGLSQDPETAPTAEIEALVDDYLAAWNEYDGDAFLGLVTSDYTFESETGPTSAETQAAFIDNLGAYEWSVTVIGERIMSGDGPWYVAQANHLDATVLGDEGGDGLSTFTVVSDNGTLKIARHVYLGRG